MTHTQQFIERPKRCGACGIWIDDPRSYSAEAQENPELDHCGCEEETRYVTRDMAIDAQDLRLEGQIY